ncbi:class I SAM-dependent methyltransferase [Mycobacterium sp. 1274756.6]|uniref:class I SAM-dependent methyltransferase n=1 Tax=Mycobacterium sp. 1274756.6 TaxID=1834076 RepID=UPI0007FCCCB1|nr:class I SAM-dependent methyltransferase [Mycobacterium sp. 1274756.6]OBJ71892.1 methyltransferase type 11 [Mycobacterium sp. 1274756.6]
MAMNLLHRWLCNSRFWADGVRDTLLPWALAGVELGPRTLEIGPGYGATTRVLVEQADDLTAVEVDKTMAERLRERFAGRADIRHADGTATGLPDDHFSSVVCFTMLHHIPTAAMQDRLLAEAYRVLQPGGVFAGSDSLSSLPFRLIHLGDICNPLEPEALRAKLSGAGFEQIDVAVSGTRQRWRARKAAA